MLKRYIRIISKYEKRRRANRVPRTEQDIYKSLNKD